MLERLHLAFVRNGAALSPEKKKRLAEITERLASLGTQFGQNVLADERAYALVLEGEADLAGLPQSLREAAAAAAEERGMKGKHAITLSRSSIEPFLQFSARRDLRETAFKAWIARGENGGATDNAAIIAETVRLRIERAHLLGYETYRRLPPRRHDGEDAGSRARPASIRLAAGAREGASRGRRLAAADPGGGRQFQARAVGLALLRGEAAEGGVRFRRGRDQAVSSARQHDRGRVRHRASPLRTEVHAARRHPALSPRRSRLGGDRRRRAPCRPLPRRLFRPHLEAERRLDEHFPQPGEACRRYPADRLQRHEFLQARRGRAGASHLRGRAHALPRVRACAPRAPLRRHLSLDRGYERRDGFRGIPFAALRALAGGAGGAPALRAPLQDRRADAGGIA